MYKTLPSGWKEKKISEIFDFKKSYTNSRTDLNNEEGDVY